MQETTATVTASRPSLGQDLIIQAHKLSEFCGRLDARPGLKSIPRPLIPPEIVASSAVQEVSFCAVHGQPLALLGPNRADQSTAIKMLIGILTPTSGQALMGGVRAALGPGSRTPVTSDGAQCRHPDTISSRPLLSISCMAGVGRCKLRLLQSCRCDRASSKAALAFVVTFLPRQGVRHYLALLTAQVCFWTIKELGGSKLMAADVFAGNC